MKENNKESPIRIFSDADRKELERLGLVIYKLKGKSIEELARDGIISSIWQNNEPSLLKLTSRSTEVAINPQKLYIPDSGGKTLAEHIRMLSQYKKEIAEQAYIPDASVIIGGAPDYIELAHEHFKATGKRLFGKPYEYRFTTSTTTDDSWIVIVGQFTDKGLELDQILKDKSYTGVWNVPLIVPYNPFGIEAMISNAMNPN